MINCVDCEHSRPVTNAANLHVFTACIKSGRVFGMRVITTRSKPTTVSTTIFPKKTRRSQMNPERRRNP